MDIPEDYKLFQFEDEETREMMKKLIEKHGNNLHVNFGDTKIICKKDIQAILNLVEKLK